jgi:RNA polymerase sigma-70 factor (ECF subfamily)
VYRKDQRQDPDDLRDTVPRQPGHGRGAADADAAAPSAVVEDGLPTHRSLPPMSTERELPPAAAAAAAAGRPGARPADSHPISTTPGGSALPFSFREVFTRECSFVWNALRRLGVPPGDIEDLAHDVFLTVHLRLGDYDRQRPIRPWLFGIAFRVAARYRELARNRYETLRPPPPDSADPSPLIDDQVARRQAQEELARALDELELGQRAVFLMHDLEGFSMPEIASALSVPLNTAYSRLRLARERLKHVLARFKTDPPRSGSRGVP